MIAIAASAATLVVKSMLTRYPGWGDFLLLDWLAEVSPSVDEIGARTGLYLAKALLATLLFTVPYLALIKFERVRFWSGLFGSVVGSVALSWGEMDIVC